MEYQADLSQHQEYVPDPAQQSSAPQFLAEYVPGPVLQSSAHEYLQEFLSGIAQEEKEEGERGNSKAAAAETGDGELENSHLQDCDSEGPQDAEISATSSQHELGDVSESSGALFETPKKIAGPKKLRVDFSPKKSAEHPIPIETQIQQVEAVIKQLKGNEANEAKEQEAHFKKKYAELENSGRKIETSEKETKENYLKNKQKAKEISNSKATEFDNNGKLIIKVTAVDAEYKKLHQELDESIAALKEYKKQLEDAEANSEISKKALEEIHAEQKNVSFVNDLFFMDKT
jgi:DNA repair exonuclease SbcCD ATPase subunit